MIQWHIHTGWWSLVNWDAWSTYETLYKRHMNINVMASRPWGRHQPLWWLVYQWDTPTSPFRMKEEALPACKETITKKFMVVLKGLSMTQIWMYYKEKLTKNLADLNIFETSMSLRDQVKSYNWTILPCLFTYVHTVLKWLRGAKILQVTPVERSQWFLWET